MNARKSSGQGAGESIPAITQAAMARHHLPGCRRRLAQTRCKIAATYYVAINFIAGYARPASPKAIFYSQQSKMTSSGAKPTCPQVALIPVMKDSGASVLNDAVRLFVWSAVRLSGAAGGDRNHFWMNPFGTPTGMGLRKIQQVKKRRKVDEPSGWHSFSV